MRILLKMGLTGLGLLVAGIPATAQTYPAHAQITAEDTAFHNRLNTASDMAERQEFGQALQLLQAAPAEQQSEYDLRFLKARILGWSGNYAHAEYEFQTLMQAYPGNTDLYVSYGYLQYYQNKLAEAERFFAGVLQMNPNYVDAQTGLTRVRTARQSLSQPAATAQMVTR